MDETRWLKLMFTETETTACRHSKQGKGGGWKVVLLPRTVPSND